MKILKKISKKELKEFLYEIDINDKKIYDEVNTNNGFGIFQFSGSTALGLVKDIHPDNFEELTAINSMARPGTIEFVPQYKDGKLNGTKKYPDVVHNLLKDSKGQILFQEQVLKIFNIIGGFTLTEADGIRGLMKKLGKADKKKEDIEKWDNQIKVFIEGAKANGLSEKEAYNISNDLLKLSSYSFNKSHAVAYTYTAVQTLYLSRYFRKYFYASTLAYEATKKDAIKSAYENCRNFGYNILPPDINKSFKNFRPVEGNNIIFGLNEIKGIGEKPINAIISNRPYKSIIDFIIKTQGERITKTVVNALVCSGCFDSLINGDRKYYEAVVNYFYENKKTTKVIELLEQKWKDALEAVPYIKTSNEDYIIYEKELLGNNFFHGNFSDEEKEKIDILYSKGYIDKSLKDVKESKLISRVPVYVSKFRIHIDKNKNEMAFVDVEDMNGDKANFPIFASYWKFIKERFQGEGMYIFALYRDQDDKIMFGSKKWVKDEDKYKLIASFRKKEIETK